MLILFAGGMGAGKDTMRGEFIRKLSLKNEVHFSFADPLKEECDHLMEAMKGSSDKEVSLLFSVSEEEVSRARKMLGETLSLFPKVNSRSRAPEIRALLQYWGSDVRRKQDKDYFVKIAQEKILEQLSLGYDVIITDGRFYNEFELIRKLHGVCVCLDTSEKERIRRIQKRDNLTPSKEALSHISEKDWKTYPYFDIIVKTDGKTVSETADEILSSLATLVLSRRTFL